MKLISSVIGLAGVGAAIAAVANYGFDIEMLWLVPGALAGALLFYKSLFDPDGESVISLFFQRKALEEKQKIRKLSGDE